MAALPLTAALVADTAGGRLVAGPSDRVFTGVSTDSRAAGPDDLFIALAGPRFDGHDFVPDLIRRGVGGVLVSRPIDAYGASTAILVPDTLAALQRMASEIRLRSGARVIAITGSAGKTTTKEVTAEFLSARYRVFRNPGNLNNHIGLPLSLLELRHQPDIAVVELGMNHPGEIRDLVRIAAPDVRVWINVGDAHIGHFPSAEALAEAKAEILTGAAPGDLLVANADDARVMRHTARFAGRCLTFGESESADVRAVNVIDRGFDGTECELIAPAGRVHLQVPLAGRAQLSNVIAAAAVALECAVPPAEIEARAARLQPVPRRGSMSFLPVGARLIDDSYNASPAATRAMLAALGATPTRGRRVAVIGEMLELGEQAAALHEACGRVAAAAGVEELVVIGGPAADALAAGAIAGGIDPAHVRRFASSDEAALVMAALVQPADLVLVKGSRGTRTDLVVDRLKAGA